MAWTQTELDTCQEAFYLLRQDVDVPTVATADSDTSIEWRKCAKAFAHAKAEVLDSHGWTWARTTEPALADWPSDVRNALVYCLARELAVPLAGRVADMKNMDALYRDKLARARVRNLQVEVSSITDAIHKEVLALICNSFTPDGELPRDVKTLTDKIDSLKEMARREVLSAHDWSFAEADYSCDSAETYFPDQIFPYHVTLPKNNLLVSACYGTDGKVAQWKLRGREIHAQERISRIVYVRDTSDYAAWHPKTYRAFILRLAADVVKCVARNQNERTLQEQLYRDALEDAKTCDTRSSNTPDEAWGDNEIADTMLYGSERRPYDDPLRRD